LRQKHRCAADVRSAAYTPVPWRTCSGWRFDHARSHGTVDVQMKNRRDDLPARLLSARSTSIGNCWRLLPVRASQCNGGRVNPRSQRSEASSFGKRISLREQERFSAGVGKYLRLEKARRSILRKRQKWNCSYSLSVSTDRSGPTPALQATAVLAWSAPREQVRQSTLVRCNRRAGQSRVADGGGMSNDGSSTKNQWSGCYAPLCRRHSPRLPSLSVGNCTLVTRLRQKGGVSRDCCRRYSCQSLRPQLTGAGGATFHPVGRTFQGDCKAREQRNQEKLRIRYFNCRPAARGIPPCRCGDLHCLSTTA
jgi:hypothetical protein